MRVRLLRCRPFSARLLVMLLLGLAFAAYCYYYTTSLVPYNKPSDNGIGLSKAVPGVVQVDRRGPKIGRRHYASLQMQIGEDQCAALPSSIADVDTVTTYPTFDFQPSWMRTKEFWDKTFEDRYEAMKNDTRRPPLKVIVVPHSHNDPGWLKTFEQYFEWTTKNIITNMVHKLHQYPNMTFIWTEIAFLNSWWERAHPSKQKDLKKLIKQGRLEITTGGWVMPDEATTHIYALIDQFIEGHNWVKTNLGVAPRTGWSIDPFGHGPTVPHLLDQSGLDGAVIQRIHYAWKQWLASRQMEEFLWLPGWAARRKPNLIVHNQPFDIYSIKSTCGPHPAACLSFDFRKIPGEYNEYTAKHEDITEQNLHVKSKTLLEGYERIGSLTPHNVVLVPLGDDFRYEYAVEFDAQYINYMKMFNYINGHKDMFNADVRFGTPLEYFNAVRDRQRDIPTLKGDFFVYSDIFSEGKPAYWSGYYTTRPYLKILTRQFEHHLRTAEILFTLVSNFIKQSKNPKLISSEKRLEKSYEQLIGARRNLGLFQHHDAITGTSKAVVMYDYGTKIFTSLYHCLRLQELAITTLMIPDETLHSQSILQSEVEWENYGKPVKHIHISLVDKNKVIVFNSLIEPRTEVITIKSNTTSVRIYDTHNKRYVPYQIAPNIVASPDGKHVVSESSFDVLFVAALPPLGAVAFAVEEHVDPSRHCLVFCNSCVNAPATGPDGKHKFEIKKMMAGDIQLENKVMMLIINRNTGFMRQIWRKDINKRNTVEMTFGAYQSAQRRSGAYLFMPDYNSPEKNILAQYTSANNVSGLGDDNLIIISGPISTEIITLYIPFLVHSIRIYNVDDPALTRGVYIENLVDFESPPKNRETELFMRIQTDLQNGEPPEFFTDQNGYQFQKRVKLDNLGIEGNYYPITTTAWLQDDESRLSVVTNHAQGASAAEPGRLELMLERRTLYDDFRGLGEGVVDNKPTLFQNWLLLETIEKPQASEPPGEPKQRIFNAKPTDNKPYELPSQTANYLTRILNYPPNVYVTDTSEVGDLLEVNAHRQFARDFPAGLHLVNLRTITDDILQQFPSSSCYMVLQRPGYSCSIGNSSVPLPSRFSESSEFSGLIMYNVTAVSLTGLHNQGGLYGLHEIQLDQMDLKTYKIRF